MKIAFSVVAVALTAVSLVNPAKAEGVRMAQVDMRTGLHIDDPANYSKDHRQYDSNTTVGAGPGGVVNGTRQSCRVVTTTIKRDDGRKVPLTLSDARTVGAGVQILTYEPTTA